MAVLEEKVRSLEKNMSAFKDFSSACEGERREQERKLFEKLAEIQGGIKMLKFMITLLGLIMTAYGLIKGIHL